MIATLLALVLAGEAAAIEATARNASGDTVVAELPDRLVVDTPVGRLKIEASTVQRLDHAGDGWVRVHLRGGDQISGSLKGGEALSAVEGTWFLGPLPEAAVSEPEQSSLDADPVVAFVNGRPIPGQRLSDAWALDPGKSREQILEKLIAEELLVEEAERRGLQSDPKVQKVMVNTLLREGVYSTVRTEDLTDGELRAYYESHRDEFVVAEKVQLKRILVADEATCDLARTELGPDPDSTFTGVASARSTDPYRRRGGDIGFVSRTGKPGVDQAIVDRAFEMKVGELSPCFETGTGWNLVYVANHRQRVERTFEQMKGSVLRKAKNDRYSQLYDAYVDQLEAAATVELDSEALEAVEPPSE